MAASAARNCGSLATGRPMLLMAPRKSRTLTVCSPRHRSAGEHSGVELQVEMPVRIPGAGGVVPHRHRLQHLEALINAARRIRN